MGDVLTFQDSEVLDVVADGTRVVVRLAAAAVVDGAGRRGWRAGVRLELDGATLQGEPTHAFGKIADSCLRHDGRDVVRLDLPGTLAGAIELALHLANGTQLVVQARALAARVADDARFTEDASC
jgi:hypothetical protein